MFVRQLASTRTLVLAAALSGLTSWFAPPSARAGVVNLVSAQEFVSVIAQGADNTSPPRQQRQDGTGTSFNGNVSITDAQLGLLVTSTQSTSIDLTADGGATFASRGGTVVNNIQASAGGESFFKAVFDVTAPAHFTIAYDQSNSARFTATTARFDGPSGLGAIPLGLPAGFGGDLTPGRYTLSADTSSGSQYQLQLVVSPAASAVPLPAQVWSGLSVIVLLSAGSVLRGKPAPRTARF